MSNIITWTIFVGFLWFIFIQYQKVNRVPIARKIATETLQDLERMGFDQLVNYVGKGYVKETKIIGGVKYYLGYIVARPNILGGIHTNDSAKLATSHDQNDKIDSLEIQGYVDCITLLPFLYFKMGPSFRRVIRKEGDIRTTT